MADQSRAWSWRHAIIKSDLPATTRHVLLTISCFMNDVGGGCYPTQEQLAEATGLSDKAIRKHTDLAVERGWLKRDKHGFKGQRWSNYEYRAAWPEPVEDRNDVPDVSGQGPEQRSTPSDTKGPEPRSQRTGTRFRKDRNDVPTTSPETSNTSPEEGARSGARNPSRVSRWKGKDAERASTENWWSKDLEELTS